MLEVDEVGDVDADAVLLADDEGAGEPPKDEDEAGCRRSVYMRRL